MSLRTTLARSLSSSRSRKASRRQRHVQTRRRLFSAIERLEDRSLLATVSIPTNLTAIDVDAGTAGVQVDIPVTLQVTEAAGVRVGGMDLSFNYDPAKLTIAGSAGVPTNLTFGSPLNTSGFSGAYTIPSTGTILVTASSGSGTDLLPQGSNINLFTIRATINGAATGTTRLNLRSGVSVIDADFEDLTLSPIATNADTDAVDGLLTISVVSNNPPVNNAPVGALPGTEDTPIALSILSVSDADAADTLTTTVSVPNNTFGTFTANAGAGTAVVTILNTSATVQIVGSQTNVNAALQTLIFTPALNRATPPDAPPTVTVVTSDGTASDTDSFNINLAEINDPPVVGADLLPAVNEDSAPIVIPVATLLANDSKGADNEEGVQTLTISSTFTSVSGGTVELVGANVVFTPTPNYSGPASFNYSVTDDGTSGGMPSPQSGSGTASFTINPVNDIPSFTPGPNQTVPFGTNTQQIVTGWATAISAGGGESQTLTFNVTNNSNMPLFSTQPAISQTGTLTFTPVGTAGTATITLVLTDNGGTANGGVNTTAPFTFTITVNSPGNSPTINVISDVTINEGAPLQTINLSGITDGGDPTQQAITVSAISSNSTLVPVTVNYTSPNNTGTLTFTSPVNDFGSSTVTVTVRDAGLDLIPGTIDDLETTRVFSVTVNPVNDAPSFVVGANQAVNEDAPAQSVPGFASSISKGPSNESTQTVTFNIGNNNPALFSAGPSIAEDGTLSYTPAANAHGTATITVTLQDNGGTANGGVNTSASQTFNITINPVNDRPTFTAANPPTVNEDAPAQTVSGFVSAFNPGPNEAGQSVTAYTVSNVSNPAMFAVAPAVGTNGTLTYTLATNAAGPVTFDLTVTDNGGTASGGINTSLPQTYTLTVNSVNDRPTFTAANPPAVNEDAPPQTVNGFVSAFNPGGGIDENTQTASAYNVTNVSNPSLFLVAPAVGTNGALAYQLNPHAFGSSTFDVTVTDSGGTANGGIATSLPQNFTLTVNPVNDAPVIAVGSNPVVAFNAPAQTVNGFASVISVGPANETGQTVTFNITNNSNLNLFASQPTINASGALMFTPAAGQQGTATITVVGQDSGGVLNGGVNDSAPVQFTITVNPPAVNSPPTINTISPQFINEDSGLLSVNFSGVSFGGDVPAQTVSISASSSNPTLIPTPNVVYSSPNSTGSLTFAPAANLNGSATITVTVRDSGLDLIPGNADDGLVTTDFLVTVNAVNDTPSFVIGGNQTVNEDAGAQIVPNFVTNISAGPSDEAGQTLTFNISGNSNPTLFAAVPTIAADGTLTYTPAANANGTAMIMVTLSDNGSGANTSGSQLFMITLNAVNDAPSFNVGANQTVFDNAPLQSVPGWATSISAGPANEAGQLVTFQITGNSNSGLFAQQPAIATNGTLTYRPAVGMSGTAIITVLAQDNGGTSNGGVNQSGPQTFTITVNPAPVNSLPTINAIGNLSINQNAGPQLVGLSGITAGGESQSLAVSATSSNPVLIPNPVVSYSSPGGNGTLTFASAVGQVGSATITVTVRDAGFDGILNSFDDGVTTTAFTVQVNEVNDPPVANDSTLAAQQNTPVSGTLSATDPDGPTRTFAIVMPPALGTLTSFDSATGAFTYTPLPGATGLDLFTFSVSDGEYSDMGVVRIAIQGPVPVITPMDGDLLVIGTPDPDTIIITPVSAGVVQVRTQASSAYFPLTNRLIVNAGESGDYVVITNIQAPTTIDLAGGDDYVSTGLGDDVIIGGSGNDRINASGGSNVIWGDNVGEQDLPAGGHDVISSLGGNDVIYGGGGNDEIYPGAGDDYVNAGQGDDTISAGMGNDRVYGGLGADYIFGDEGNDLLVGGGGGDLISGRSGSDVLIGGLGADTLNGDDGNDLLFGGDTTNSASSLAGDANDLALMAMLASWAASRPAGLATSVSAGNDNAPDSLSGYVGDDDFYVHPGDNLGDFNMPFMGTDRLF